MRFSDESFAFSKQLLDWYDENARVLPWRGTRVPYAVWLSEIMLQQTRVDTVIPYYNRFRQTLPSIRALAEANEDILLKLWEGLGYYRRVRNMQKAAQMVVCDFGGIFPDIYAEILRLPGIGAYTAGAIASICFDLPTPAVDGNVLRVITRLTGSRASIDDPKTKRNITDWLTAAYHAIPRERRGDLTQSLMEFGALVCLPNGTPLCESCPLRKECVALRERRITEIPVRAEKAKKRAEALTVFVLISGGTSGTDATSSSAPISQRIALSRRPDAGLLAGLWELPNTPGALTEEQARDWARERDLAPTSVRAGKRHTHIFTHIRWEMHPFVIKCDTAPQTPFGDFVWVTAQALSETYALPTAFARILREFDVHKPYKTS